MQRAGRLSAHTFVYSLILSLAVHGLFLSPLAAKDQTQDPAEVCASTLESATTSRFLSENGHWAFEQFRKLRIGVPPRLGQYLDANEDRDISDIIRDVMKIRQKTAREMRRLSQNLKGEMVISQVLERGAEAVDPTDNEMANADEHQEDLQQVYWKNLDQSEKSELKNTVRHFYIPLRSHMDEVAVSFHLPGLVTISELAGDRLPPQMIQNTDPSDILPTHLADKELDVVFKQGRAWGEVKSSRAGWNYPAPVRKLIKQAKKMQEAARLIGQHTNESIEIHYFFMGQKPPKEVQKLFEEWNIRMHWAPHPDEFKFPSRFYAEDDAA